MAPRTRPGATSKVDYEDGSDEKEDLAQLSDAAMRKKKNADAQAAFRARRSNYIAVLEETVTNLESIVDHIQESLRISENESATLYEENKLLKQSGHEREALWRSLWRNHSGTGSLPDSAIPPLPAVFNSSPSPTTTPQPPSLRPRPLYAHNHRDYNVSSSSVAEGSYSMVGNYSSQATSSAYGIPVTSHSADAWEPYARNLISMTPAPAVWPRYSQPNISGGVDWSAHASNNSSDSMMAHYAGTDDPNSPSNDGKVEILAYASPPSYPSPPSYSGPPSRSSSSSSTMSSNSASATSSSPPLAAGSSTQEDFPAAYDFGRRLGGSTVSNEIVLHGGIANIPTPGQRDDGIRLKLPPQSHLAVASDRSSFPSLPSNERSDAFNCSHLGNNSEISLIRSCRTGSSSPPPPDESTPKMNTVAVLKAHTFGALRRTRTRKRADDAVKLSQEALESRGITMDFSRPRPKRRRTYEDDSP